MLFSDAQARACFDAGVTLVSPFVGRVTDWYKQSTGRDYGPEEDPGVRFVRGVCRRVVEGGFDTVVMGASFRTVDQVLALAGCPRLTISPALLEELASSEGEVAPAVSMDGEAGARPTPIDEPRFRWEHNADAMANDKLAEAFAGSPRITMPWPGASPSGWALRDTCPVGRRLASFQRLSGISPGTR